MESTGETMERDLKPDLPPLMRETFTRMARTIVSAPEYARQSAAFHGRRLPQLPPLYDTVLAGIITSEPELEDPSGSEVQTWDLGKHTLLSLSERGAMYLKSKVHEKVQDLAPGPLKDTKRIKEATESMMSDETLAMLACTYNFPPPTSDPLPKNRIHNPRLVIKHASQMYTAYIGALRVPYPHNEEHGADMILRLDKYIHDLVQPAVWVKLDDLVKARHRGDKFGEQQLLKPMKRSLLKRMTSFSQTSVSPMSLATIGNATPGVSNYRDSIDDSGSNSSPAPSHTPMGPSMLHSPTPSLLSLSSRRLPDRVEPDLSAKLSPRPSRKRHPPTAPASMLGPTRSGRSCGRLQGHAGGPGGPGGLSNGRKLKLSF